MHKLPHLLQNIVKMSGGSKTTWLSLQHDGCIDLARNKCVILSHKNLTLTFLHQDIREITASKHDDVIKWKHFPRYWPFVRGIPRSPVNSHTNASDPELWCFFYLRLNKHLSKESWGWWFETPSRSLWRQCNVHPGHIFTWKHNIERKLFRYFPCSRTITKPALVLTMAQHQLGDRPLFKPMSISLSTYFCVIGSERCSVNFAEWPVNHFVSNLYWSERVTTTVRW